MRIATFASPQAVMEDTNTIHGRFVIVIDALRATSVIAAALAEGARSVVPVTEIEEAVRLYRNIDSDALLCGERDGKPIPGFNLGNSPLEYTKKAVSGRTLIMTTTNGTRAIHAASGAGMLALGALVNASAVARDAANSKLDVTILCAGTRGRFTTEHILAAGAIIDALGHGIEQPDDLSLVALDLYLRNADNPLLALEHCAHARFLSEAGYAADIDYCMRRDILSVVPYYEKGVVRLL